MLYAIDALVQQEVTLYSFWQIFISLPLGTKLAKLIILSISWYLVRFRRLSGLTRWPLDRRALGF